MDTHRPTITGDDGCDSPSAAVAAVSYQCQSDEILREPLTECSRDSVAVVRLLWKTVRPWEYRLETGMSGMMWHREQRHIP